MAHPISRNAFAHPCRRVLADASRSFSNRRKRTWKNGLNLRPGTFEAIEWVLRFSGDAGASMDAVKSPAAPRRGEVLIDLALQGGGAHGAFTWGVLDRLLEEPWLWIDGISGASAG